MKNAQIKFRSVAIATNGNKGQAKQQYVDFALTRQVRKHDRVPYNVDSDIPEYSVSVKSAGFTLMSGNLCVAQDFDGIVNEYFTNTASESVAYVDNEMNIYILSMCQFREFIYRFCSLNRESTRHGGRYKVKMRNETKAVRAWLNEI